MGNKQHAFSHSETGKILITYSGGRIEIKLTYTNVYIVNLQISYDRSESKIRAYERSTNVYSKI